MCAGFPGPFLLVSPSFPPAVDRVPSGNTAPMTLQRRSLPPCEHASCTSASSHRSLPVLPPRGGTHSSACLCDGARGTPGLHFEAILWK